MIAKINLVLIVWNLQKQIQNFSVRQVTTKFT